MMISNKQHICELVTKYYFPDATCKTCLNVETSHGINSRVIRVCAGDRDCVVQLITGYTEQTLHKLELFEKCFGSGIRVPQIVKTVNNQCYIEIDNMLIVVMNYYSGEEFNGSRESLCNAARELARMNMALANFDCPIIDRSKWYRDITDDEKDALIMKKKHNYDIDFANALSFITPLRKELDAHICSDEPSNNVFIDLHPSNILFEKDDVKCIFDFDSICFDEVMISASFAADRFSRDIDGLILFMKAYAEVDERITDEMIKYAPSYVQREALNRINYILKKYLDEDDTKWMFELPKHIAIINRMYDYERTKH